MENTKVMISGIKCDNPECDFRDDSVKYEDYPNWLNKPCPKCGQNLLTKEDYKVCRFLVYLAKLSNIYNKFPFSGKEKKAKIKFELNGTGNVDISEIHYYDDYSK